MSFDPLMSLKPLRRLSCVCVLLLIWVLPSHAQDDPPESTKATEAKPALAVIADEPKTIDPAALMPAVLAVSATHDFSDSSLREVIAWLQDEHGLVVLLDKNALGENGILPAEPISDRLADAPIYLLLNRLGSLGLDWYFEDDVLHITSIEVAEEHRTTLTYNVGDLLDDGHYLGSLTDVVTQTTDPTSWGMVGGDGAITALGDVLFVRQTDDVQREIEGMLTALRSHGRQTFVNDPTQHLALRSKLAEKVSVDFLDMPLETAVRQLGEAAGADIRLDMTALRELRVREREPVSLKLTDRSLETVLQAVLLELKLTWILRDGVLWITGIEEAEEILKTAVYDVRDLCRDFDESDSLSNAVMSQTEPTSWDIVGGEGALVFAKPGTMVVAQTERNHIEVLELLETYRTALRASKPRPRDEDDPNEVVTVYYRTHANVANDLVTLLPILVRPESWRNEAQPEAAGEVFVVASTPELANLKEAAATSAETDQSALTLVTARAVLIVAQTRAVHDEIEEIIRRVESGDTQGFGGGMGGGMGGGGGGFGGGFLSVPPERPMSQGATSQTPTLQGPTPVGGPR